MIDQQHKPAGEAILPMDRVEKVGDYFKTLFARSLKLDLEHGLRERPWEDAPVVPVRRPFPATDAAGGREPEDALEEERV